MKRANHHRLFGSAALIMPSHQLIEAYYIKHAVPLLGISIIKPHAVSRNSSINIEIEIGKKASSTSPRDTSAYQKLEEHRYRNVPLL